MNRREYLSVTTATIVAGCSGQQDTSAFETTDETVTIRSDDFVVDFDAVQWTWLFSYTLGNDLTVRQSLHVPVDTPVVLRGTSRDVEHALTIPAFDTTVAAEADATDIGRITPAETGEIEFLCTVDCGEGHEQHTGTINVVGADEFDEWYTQRTSEQ